MDRVTEFLETEFPDADERGLVRAVGAAPKDNTAKLVYADWLDERDDPRGEYLRLLAGKERTAPKTVKRLATLRKKCPPAWLSAIGELHSAFAELKKQVEVGSGRSKPKLRATFDRGLWDVRYSCDLMFGGGQLAPALAFLARSDVSPVIRSISLDDVQFKGTANGFMEIDLRPLTKAKAGFAYLETFQTLQGEGVIIGDAGPTGEGGQIAKILALAPRLKSLVVPSAPGAPFFTGAEHPLEVLSICANAGTNKFVRNLARSTRFRNLREVIYQDLNDDTFPEQGDWTPFADFVALLRSRAMAKVEKITLTGVVAAPEQMRELKKLRPKGLTARRHPYSDAEGEDGGDDEPY